MKRYLLGIFYTVIILSVATTISAQVKLTDSGTTKFYDNGTRITYFEMADFPNSPEMREFVSKIVLENPDVNRAMIYRNGKTFMYEALQSVEPDMIVDAVNDALAEYKANVGDFPPPSPQDYEKQPSNVKVTKHSGNVAPAKVSSSPEMRVSEDKNLEKKSSNLHAFPMNTESVMQQPSDGNSKSKNIEQVSSAKYNENGKNK
ncbi:MAG: hypothetical protein J6W06_03190 [Bacteroidales bacterium]|jgi:hypothetical protein|nr:hypothetical protein [Bacteroidales bacterium]